MVLIHVDFFQRLVEHFGIVGANPVFNDLIRSAQMKDVLRVVAALKADGAKPRLETLAVKPFFDGV
jgi:hypothetical protein